MRKRSRINAVALSASLAGIFGMLSACSSDELSKISPELEGNQWYVDGRSETYTMPVEMKDAWALTKVPGWSTPYATSGEAGESLKLYVENNGRGVDRTGEIVVRYANGMTRSVTITQSANSTNFNLERSQAVGWGFDVTSYMDSRALTDQVFNTSKLLKFKPNAISVNDHGTSMNFVTYYGDSSDSMNDNINATLQLDVKVNAFSASLDGSFGKTAMSSTKRQFAWMRGYYQQKVVTLNVDMSDAQKNGLFTMDFEAERQAVIDAEGSDASISRLINRYGTHLVTSAGLGGYLDYFYSFVQTDQNQGVDLTAAVNFGFNSKFGLDADVNLKKHFEGSNTERIEKFIVKGGDAMGLTNQVISDSLTNDAVKKWRESLNGTNKYELVTFRIYCISILFPRDIRRKINDYISRVMYYSQKPVTRSTNN